MAARRTTERDWRGLGRSGQPGHRHFYGGAAIGDLGVDLAKLLVWVPVALLLARLSFRMADE